MKKSILFPIMLSAALPLCASSFFFPSHASSPRLIAGTEEPDTVIYEEEEVWTDADSVEFLEVIEDEGISTLCPFNYSLLEACQLKDGNFELKNSTDQNYSVQFAFQLFYLSDEKPSDSYLALVYNIFNAGMMKPCKDAKTLEKLAELRWKDAKETYQEEMNAAGVPFNHYYRTAVQPVWKSDDCGGVTTYSVEDEAFRGGAHGMNWQYCLSLHDSDGTFVGLTDLFREDCLPKVFALIGEKLAARPNAPQDSDIWQPVAEIQKPTDDDYLMRAGGVEEWQGKWYPRPAVTPCGVLFSYQRYEKDCYAAGVIHILLSNEEIAAWRK
ncbi:MAG: DUF3298 domain-containing protein [Alloprevotella sp.]